MKKQYITTIFLPFLLFSIRLVIATTPEFTVVKYEHNPIYNENGANNVRWINIVHWNETFYMLYSHSGGPTDTYYATSKDGLNFTYHGYALRRGPGHSWDSNYIEIHTILKYNDTHWVAYYCGTSTSSGVWNIGCAFSTDLVSWVKYSGNPILKPSTEEQHVADPVVMKTSAGKYLMYYGCYNGSSTDGGPTPVSLTAFTVTWQISLATSFDGLTWSKSNVVLTGNPQIEWCKYYVAPSDATEIDGKILLLVVGDNTEDVHQGGLFMSSDLGGYNFREVITEPYPCLPIVPNTWESQIIVPYAFDTYAGTTYIYYNGYDGYRWQVGRAQFGDSLVPTSNIDLVAISVVILIPTLLVGSAIFITNRKGKRKNQYKNKRT
jgi:predicted GH43/DUF377 family glycosyl hydrolase